MITLEQSAHIFHLVRPLKTLCAWCGVLICGADGPGPVSHGLCGACAEQLEKEVA